MAEIGTGRPQTLWMSLRSAVAHEGGPLTSVFAGWAVLRVCRDGGTLKPRPLDPQKPQRIHRSEGSEVTACLALGGGLWAPSVAVLRCCAADFPVNVDVGAAVVCGVPVTTPRDERGYAGVHVTVPVAPVVPLTLALKPNVVVALGASAPFQDSLVTV